MCRAIKSLQKIPHKSLLHRTAEDFVHLRVKEGGGGTFNFTCACADSREEGREVLWPTAHIRVGD